MDTTSLIYIVEDDEGICEVYEGAFEGVYRTRIFTEGGAFLAAFAQERPDLIILDIMLPDMDGLSILTEVREKDETVPVIIVSAKSDELSFVRGLNRGADDYMAKPFSILELMARVRAGLRRGGLFVTKVRDYAVDANTYKIFFKGKDLKLTLKEFKLLRTLIGKAGVTLEREALFREVWGEDFMGESRTLDIHVATVREKIRVAGGSVDSIVTVRGIGYRFEGL